MTNTRETRTISQLPVPTWSWLHINSTKREWDWSRSAALSPITAFEPIIHGPEGFILQRDITPLSFHSQKPASSVLGELPELVASDQTHSLHVEIPEGFADDEPLLIDYPFDGSCSALANRLSITAHPGSACHVVIRYRAVSSGTNLNPAGGGAESVGSAGGGQSSCAESPGGPEFVLGSEFPRSRNHAAFTSIDVRERAHLKVTQFQMLGDADIHSSAISAQVAQEASLCLLLGDTGAADSVTGCDVLLAGKEARCHLNSLYLASGSQSKDLNYRITYAAEDTEGIISARGALAGSAKKVFKSTIDFLPGASRSKGREEEAVLVLSDQVRNISTPLLLCGEDNVEGQHATSIGRPDPDKLYYLKSRGFDEAEARKLLVEASFTPFLDQIQPEDIKEELVSRIREVVHHGE